MKYMYKISWLLFQNAIYHDNHMTFYAIFINWLNDFYVMKSSRTQNLITYCNSLHGKNIIFLLGSENISEVFWLLITGECRVNYLILFMILSENPGKSIVPWIEWIGSKHHSNAKIIAHVGWLWLLCSFLGLSNFSVLSLSILHASHTQFEVYIVFLPARYSSSFYGRNVSELTHKHSTNGKNGPATSFKYHLTANSIHRKGIVHL